ncbi:MAG: hypothetical protein E6R13_01775 [Spirochaetes bacterium]|nr:MAG: hypothetical protein E6R13_01775 [Spirochaetota bacterium]
MSELVRRLGIEKNLDLVKDFDMIVDKYRKIADATGYKGELRFKKEGGFVVVFVVLNDTEG